MSYDRVAPRIYKDSRTGHFYERPKVNGKWTYRKLSGRTLKLAKEELAAKRTDQARAVQGLAKDPYAPKAKTVGELCAEYQNAGCPDRQHHPRAGLALEAETTNIVRLLPFWGMRLPEKVTVRDCAKYFYIRKKQVGKGTGGRTVDMELGTLNNVLTWAVTLGKSNSNPLANGRPRFRNTKTIKHCRDFMPVDGDELHALAAHFFEDPRSEVLGWQLLLEAMTGCRTSEVLKLRWDAKHRGEAGFIEGDWLWLNRAKGGVKPFAHVHPALRDCVGALRLWRERRFPRSPWWLPSPKVDNQPIDRGSLTHALKLAGKLIAKAHRTSHGLRAYYVTVRRSQGISDAQIADEIGDKSGASIIVSTYGSVPPNWRGAPGLSWLPKGEPAWATIKTPPRAKQARKKPVVARP